MKVIIIEDEPLMAQALQEQLERLDEDIEVLARLGSVTSALDYFKDNPQPELFFSDIQLGDGLSFEIFRQLKTSTPVIFCTAFDEYALEAFKINGIDYLLKPFSSVDLQATITKYRNLTQSATPPTFDPDQLLTYFGLHSGSAQTRSSILVYQADRIIPVKKNHLALVYKQHGITYTLTFDRKKYVLDQNLDDLEQSLGADFFRANRQFIVHREAVKEVSRYFARKLLLQLQFEFPEKIVVSKAKASGFLAWLQQH